LELTGSNHQRTAPAVLFLLIGAEDDFEIKKPSFSFYPSTFFFPARDYIFDRPSRVFEIFHFLRVFLIQARRAAAKSFFLTHCVFQSPEAFTASMISLYSSGDTRVVINLPRFSLSDSAGRPTGFGSLMVFSSSASQMAFAGLPLEHPQT
jgi:hypothetical protein